MKLCRSSLGSSAGHLDKVNREEEEEEEEQVFLRWFISKMTKRHHRNRFCLRTEYATHKVQRLSTLLLRSTIEYATLRDP